jgi:hypothetical protein
MQEVAAFYSYEIMQAQQVDYLFVALDIKSICYSIFLELKLYTAMIKKNINQRQLKFDSFQYISV